MLDALSDRSRSGDQETGWFTQLAALVVTAGDGETAEARANAVDLAHVFVHMHVMAAEAAGMRPDHLLKRPSRSRASDGGVAFQWRPGTVVEGFLPGIVVARGPLGFRTAHHFEEDGHARALTGKVRAEVLDAFDRARGAGEAG